MVHWNRTSISNRFRDIWCKYIWVMTLTFEGHAKSSVTWPFDTPCAISYRCSSIVTESVCIAIFEIIINNNHFWGHDLDLLRVTWRHRSCDHSICHRPFPIGCPLEQSLYLLPFSRYSTPIIGARTRTNTRWHTSGLIFCPLDRQKWHIFQLLGAFRHISTKRLCPYTPLGVSVVRTPDRPIPQSWQQVDASDNSTL